MNVYYTPNISKINPLLKISFKKMIKNLKKVLFFLTLLTFFQGFSFDNKQQNHY